MYVLNKMLYGGGKWLVKLSKSGELPSNIVGVDGGMS